MSHKPGGRRHYFPPGPQLASPSQLLRALLPISLLGEQRHEGVNSLPKTVIRQVAAAMRTDCNPGPSAPESSTLTTRLPSHPSGVWQSATSLRAVVTHVPHGMTQCYLPPGSGQNTAFTAAKLVLSVMASCIHT